MHLLTRPILVCFSSFPHSQPLGPHTSRTSRRHKTWCCTDLSPVTSCATVACENGQDWTGHGPAQAGDAVCSGSTSSSSHASGTRHFTFLDLEQRSLSRPRCCSASSSCFTFTPPAGRRHRRQDGKLGSVSCFTLTRPAGTLSVIAGIGRQDARNAMANLAGREPELRPCRSWRTVLFFFAFGQQGLPDFASRPWSIGCQACSLTASFACWFQASRREGWELSLFSMTRSFASRLCRGIRETRSQPL
jgi:hypothetical protein